MNYKASLSKWLQDLEQHPKVEILHHYQAPALGSEQIQAQLREAEPSLLSQDFQAFYEQFNGLQVLWRFQRPKLGQKPSQNPLPWSYPLEVLPEIDGGLWFSPLEQFVQTQILDCPSPLGMARVKQGAIWFNQEQWPSLKDYWQDTLGQFAWLERQKALHYELDQLALQHFFQAYQPLKKPRSPKILKQNYPSPNSLDLQTKLAEHGVYLQSGGGQGRWKVGRFKESNLRISIYDSPLLNPKGQVQLEHLCLRAEIWDARAVQLTHGSLLGSQLYGLDFTEANLEACLMTDCLIKNCLFVESQVQGSDFSRSYLKDCNFMNADLRNVDFEDAYLENVHFQGARLQGANFHHAELINCSY